jgi:predicted RNA binding protein YcfA (HicA-like mRNA interferase family)
MPTARELLRFLRHHGYREVRQSGSHLILEHAEKPLLVIPVHRGKDLPRGLLPNPQGCRLYSRRIPKLLKSRAHL